MNTQITPANIVAILPTQTDKVRFEVRDEVKRGPTNILAKLNRSDERFNSSRSEVAWLSVVVKDAIEDFPDLADEIALVAESKERMDLNKPRPFMYEGEPVKMKVTESHTTTSKWDVENLNQAAKQDGNGNYCIKDGYLIFTDRSFVPGKPEHELIPHDTMTNDISNCRFFYKKDRYSSEEEMLVSAAAQQHEEMPDLVNN